MHKMLYFLKKKKVRKIAEALGTPLPNPRWLPAAEGSAPKHPSCYSHHLLQLLSRRRLQRQRDYWLLSKRDKNSNPSNNNILFVPLIFDDKSAKNFFAFGRRVPYIATPLAQISRHRPITTYCILSHTWMTVSGPLIQACPLAQTSSYATDQVTIRPSLQK